MLWGDRSTSLPLPASRSASFGSLASSLGPGTSSSLPSSRQQEGQRSPVRTDHLGKPQKPAPRRGCCFTLPCS